jgi:hypothetical protein
MTIKSIFPQTKRSSLLFESVIAKTFFSGLPKGVCHSHFSILNILGALQVPMLLNFFPSSLMTRPNKLEGLPLITLSSWVLEFDGTARANPTGGPFSFLGKLLVLPANVRLDWIVFDRCKHSSLFGLVISNEEKKFYNIETRF